MKNLEDKITWNWTGAQVEAESFRQIEAEVGSHTLKTTEWRVLRRLIHTTTEFGLKDEIRFHGNPVQVGLKALREGRPIYCDSNMIRSGISVPKLQTLYSDYKRDHIHCYVADPKVAEMARIQNCTRALAAIDYGRAYIDDGIVLIGNAPLALAGICRMVDAGEVRPRLIIGLPVGFVNVIESKEWLMRLNVPHIVLTGRRGGSPLAVAALHGILESA
jgi:Precorrin isomerase